MQRSNWDDDDDDDEGFESTRRRMPAKGMKGRMIKSEKWLEGLLKGGSLLCFLFRILMYFPYLM